MRLTAARLPGDPLHPSDLDRLAQSGISAQTANAALLRRVDSLTGAELMGRNGSADYSGIVVPYIWPGEDWVREHRLRRDHPEIENGKPKNKYLSPPGTGNMLYFQPATDQAWLSDIEIPILLVEGEKKCLALVSSPGTGLAKVGTLGQIQRILTLVDKVWSETRVMGGLASGEGLIWAVRDELRERVPIHEKGHILRYEEQVSDNGEQDKRLLLVETEFARVLSVAEREANTLSAIIRQAWDTGNLRILTKKQPAQSTEAHISIIGHITKDG
jgi:hypothetical protein